MKKSADRPIHNAIQKGFFQQVRFYVDQGYDVNSRDADGKTPLILCSQISDEKWSVGLARLLLENEARISVCDRQGYNALHHACINQRHELVDVFLAALDCSILSKCRQGNTSLHFAASLGNLDIVKSLAALLIRYKIKLDPRNKKGFTPLHQAFRCNNIECGDMLMEFGADTEVKDPSNKAASQLRAEALERLALLTRLSRLSSAEKTVRKMKKEVSREQPEPAADELREAKPFDKRNDPEYVFNTTAIDYFQQKVVKDLMKRTERKKRLSKDEWKDELLKIWHCYEIQSASTYRKPARFVTTSASRGSLSHRGSTSTPVGKRQSRLNVKSRAGSITSTDGYPTRRSSNPASRRGGMPPLVRTQSRAAFNI